jgi:hypothetical protein
MVPSLSPPLQRRRISLILLLLVQFLRALKLALFFSFLLRISLKTLIFLSFIAAFFDFFDVGCYAWVQLE